MRILIRVSDTSNLAKPERIILKRMAWYGKSTLT
jgi:hypothetical protein